MPAFKLGRLRAIVRGEQDGTSRRAAQPDSRRSEKVNEDTLAQDLAGQLEPSIPGLPSDPVELPAGELNQDGVPDETVIDALDVMAHRIYTLCCVKGWFHPLSGNDEDGIATGVCIRSKHRVMRCLPVDCPRFQTFESAAKRLGVRVTIKLQSRLVDATFRNYIDDHPALDELLIDANTHIQILEDIGDLWRARKSQYAAFVRDEGVLVVWADRVEDIIPSAQALEKSLVRLLWSDEADQLGLSRIMPTLPVDYMATSRDPSTIDPAQGHIDVEDPEKSMVMEARKSRPVILLAPMIAGGFICMVTLLMSLLLRALLVRYALDHDATRFALVAVLPLMGMLAMYPCYMIVGNVVRMFGPIAQFGINSAYFSAIPPPRTHSSVLLPITVQMPVYKESLEEVIMPTIESLKRATSTFERQGGHVNIIVCDDGLQLLPEEERGRRIRYYLDSDLGYVARSPNGQDGYVRRGAFKKASNLNFCNEFTLRIEDIMDDLRAKARTSMGRPEEFWSEEEEETIYAQALQQAIENSPGRTWAQGALRFGEVVLLIDADTRVPDDCLLDGSLEMLQSPDIAYLQHASGCLLVANHFLEKALAFFLEMVQITIPFNVSSGDCPPLMGHNVFLRWKALQDCATVDRDDGVKKIWPEDLVSEDLALGLQIQCKGWKARWATYSSLKFEEGVSLTCNDEAARWKKYSYGVGDVLFNPLKYWLSRGPLAKTSLDILRSKHIPPHHKATLFGYFFSYYALASAWFTPIITYVLVGIFDLNDDFYVTSWEILFVCLIMFPGFNNLAFFALYYRLKVRSLGAYGWELFKWIPFFWVFFAGLPFAVSTTLLYQICGLGMSWGSTLKSVESSNFFVQLPVIWRNFRVQLVVFALLLAGAIVGTTSVVPVAWRVSNLEAIVPLVVTSTCHLLWPFALDPYFTTFSF